MNTSPLSSPRTAGRPQDVDIDERVTKATLEALSEQGYHSLSVSRIAAIAGVPRTTVYRRGKSRAELAVAAVAVAAPPVESVNTGDALDDLAVAAADFIVRFAAHPVGAVAMELHAAALHDQELLMLLLQYLWPRKETVDAMTERVFATGKIRPELDAHDLRDLVFGPLMYRWLVAKMPMGAAEARALARAAMRGCTHAG